ncbi:MAG: hypothetical protein PHT00_00275 [Candidatus Methanomethylophilus sp.]|jgi:uncharacterized paraquat-inducible protein A|nr:hypothetical protein [Methanomethylophilus sp.]
MTACNLTVRCPGCHHDITHNMTATADGGRVCWCPRCGRNVTVRGRRPLRQAVA